MPTGSATPRAPAYARASQFLPVGGGDRGRRPWWGGCAGDPANPATGIAVG